MIGAALAALSLALASRAGPPDPEGVAAPAPPALGVPLRLESGGARGHLSFAPGAARDSSAPTCIVEWCPARVEVPGLTAIPVRASKTELVVTLLDQAHIEPVASIAWFFVVTGLRVDWSPANGDASYGATAHGWGNVFVRLRFRMDSWNRPTIPIRPRERLRLQREGAGERERAAAAGLSGPHA